MKKKHNRFNTQIVLAIKKHEISPDNEAMCYEHKMLFDYYNVININA